ncbi:MAG TPA: cytidylate kinase family protein [Pseudonocardiaceae bacterium]
MGSTRAIAISGALGSGKSSVAKYLARRLGLQYVSTGDLQRSIASRRRLTTLELNRAAEQDQRIDDEVDDVLRGLAADGTPVVVDSRMAWWFVPNALSVHLTVDPAVAAERMHARRNQAAEEYTSREEAMRLAADRAQSERLRFRQLYDVDTARLRNYEVIVDTTSAPMEAVAEEVVAAYGEPPDPGAARPLRMMLSPAQVRPTRHVSASELAEALSDEPIRVGFSHPYYFVAHGHARLAAALRAGRTRVAATLVAEGAETLDDGRTADDVYAEAAELDLRWDAVVGAGG